MRLMKFAFGGGAAAAAVALTTALTASGASAQVMQIAAGDVWCLGYQETDQTCTMNYAFSGAPGAEGQIVTQFIVQLPSAPVTITAEENFVWRGDQLCSAMSSFTFTAESDDPAAAQLVTAQLDAVYAQLGSITEVCSELTLENGVERYTQASVDGQPVPMAARTAPGTEGRLFRAGDPQIPGLTLRPLN